MRECWRSPDFFGVEVVLFVFLVVQKCPNALVEIYSQSIYPGFKFEVVADFYN